MTKDDVLRMAQTAGFPTTHHLSGRYDIAGQSVARFERFANLVAAAEREAILQMSADNWYKTQKDYDDAIRARGETK
jgi:hypothetical protein